jgi:sugar lactone lactonase YvrE
VSDAIAELAVDARCTLGEGPVWHAREQALLWTDIANARLWRYGLLDGATESWPLPDRLCCFAFCASGRLLLGLAKGLYRATFAAMAGEPLAMEPIVSVETDVPATRLNDGRTDRGGRFVFGTMNEQPGHAPIGSFYQFSTSHGLRRLNLDRVGISNSICFSPDGATMYFCDSGRRIIQCGDYDGERAIITGVRDFVRFGRDDGIPDGSMVDAEGGLWNAEWGRGRVRRYTPDGRVDREIAVPAANPTCVAFGGPDLNQLFITSSRQEMSDEQLRQMPAAGGVFRAFIGSPGLADRPFADR